MWFVRTKGSVFKGFKCQFGGLIMAGFSKAVFFVLLGRTVS